MGRQLEQDDLAQPSMHVRQSSEAATRNAAERGRRFIERRDTILSEYIASELCSMLNVTSSSRLDVFLLSSLVFKLLEEMQRRFWHFVWMVTFSPLELY